jgi:hypothetical protein
MQRSSGNSGGGRIGCVPTTRCGYDILPLGTVLTGLAVSPRSRTQSQDCPLPGPTPAVHFYSCDQMAVGLPDIGPRRQVRAE